MTEQEERQAVIAEALTWCKTPFKWGACIKGVGVDCGRFLAGSFNAAGVKQIDISSFPPLSPQWFLHRSDESFLNQIRRFAVEYELQPGEIPQPGDIVVAKCGRDWAHSALVIDWPKVIGAANEHTVSVWNDIRKSPQYGHRPLKYFNPWGKPIV